MAESESTKRFIDGVRTTMQELEKAARRFDADKHPRNNDGKFKPRGESKRPTAPRADRKPRGKTGDHAAQGAPGGKEFDVTDEKKKKEEEQA